MAQHIAQLRSKHEALCVIRLIQESFTITGPHGQHVNMAFERLRAFLWVMGLGSEQMVFTPKVVKALMRIILMGLHFLYTECHIIHTGKCEATRALKHLC